MTRYRELMEELLKNNRESVDSLKKCERIIARMEKFKVQWEKLSGKCSIGNSCVNIYGSGKPESKTSMQNFKILMDEFLYSDKSFDVDAQHRETWIFHTVTDLITGGIMSIDVGMSFMKDCKKIVKLVPITEKFREKITYKCKE